MWVEGGIIDLQSTAGFSDLWHEVSAECKLAAQDNLQGKETQVWHSYCLRVEDRNLENSSGRLTGVQSKNEIEGG